MNNDYVFDNKGAIPEAKPVKRELLMKRQRAQESITRYNRNRYLEDFDEMRNAIVSLYYTLQPHLMEMEASAGRDFSHLHQLQNHPKPVEDYKEIGPEDEKFWKEKFRELQQALYDLEVTKIALKKRSKPHGYEFLNGLDHTLGKREDPGWRRLKRNCINMRRLLRKDTDIVGLIYGGNRTGKTTLSLQMCRLIHEGKPEGKLKDQQIIFQDEDFKEAMNNGEQYQANHIDEMKLLFHKRDGMDTDQKVRNKMMTTYAKKNMAMIGCDNNFYNIDQEFLSDKVDFVIRVPKRGRFEFYSKGKVGKFKKGDDNKPVTPTPDFTGKFPDLDPDNGKTDPLWKQYREVEHNKMDVESDEKSDEELVNEVAQEVEQNYEDFKKELEGRDPIISDDIIQFEYPEISTKQAKIVKNVVEQKVDLSNE